MICHDLAKFGEHRYSSSRGIIILVYHVIKKDHVIKGAGNYNNRSSSR